MRKRMCYWEGVVLDTVLNIHISRCENKKCPEFLSLVDEDICNQCQNRMPIQGRDKLAESMETEVYGVSLDERDEEIVIQLFNTHCRKCPRFDEKERLCLDLKCDHIVPIRSLMKNSNIHCPLGLW